MRSESAGRVVGMYTEFGKSGIASCRVCLVIAHNDGSLIITNGTAGIGRKRRNALPTVTLPGLTAEQLETIVATATGTAQPAKGVRS